MKNKKILTLLIVVAIVAVVLIVFAAVFNVKSCELYFYNQDGQAVANAPDAPTADDVGKDLLGNNVFFLSESAAIEKLNKEFPQYQVLDIVKVFPSKVRVHMVKRVAVYKVGSLYVDSFGYICELTDNSVIDVSSALVNAGDVVSTSRGSKLQFNNQTNNQKFDLMLQTVNSVWRFKYAYNDIPEIIGSFEFNQDLSLMTINTSTGAKIVVHSPERNLFDRLLQAFSVYNNEVKNLGKDNVVINVPTSGKISSGESEK